MCSFRVVEPSDRAVLPAYVSSGLKHLDCTDCHLVVGGDHDIRRIVYMLLVVFRHDRRACVLAVETVCDVESDFWVDVAHFTEVSPEYGFAQYVISMFFGSADVKKTSVVVRKYEMLHQLFH